MAAENKKISQLAAASPLLISDEIVVQRGATPPNLKASIQQILDFTAAGSGTGGVIPKWVDEAGNLNDSVISQVGSNILISGDFIVDGDAAVNGNATVMGIIESQAALAAVIIYETGKTVGQSGELIFDLENSIDSRATYTSIRGVIVTNTAGAEDGRLDFVTKDGGANFTILRLNGADNLVTLFGDLSVAKTIIAGTGSTVLTTATGLLRHQAIDPAIAGANVNVVDGVLWVHPELHVIASHTDTAATGVQLNTLVGGGNADALHVHALLAHTIASHSDTTATGVQLNSLTDNSMADTLHRHSELSANDGSPDANFALDLVGNAVLSAGQLSINGGIITAGVDGVTRGVLTVWDGSGGSTAGYINLRSRNGTLRTLWIEDSGTLKLHTKVPVNNADGVVVGAQT